MSRSKNREMASVPGTGPRGRRGGFTLVEMLVVIGIIIVLAAILLPMVMGARGKAARYRIMGDLQVVATGLEEYKKVFGDYPRQTNPNPMQGFRQKLLVQFLIGNTGDGVRANNTGDNVNTQGGKKWGPFVPPEKFKVENGALIDSSSKEVQYYPRYNLYDRRVGASSQFAGYLLGNVVTTAPPKAMFNIKDGIYIDGTAASEEAKDHVIHTLYMLGDGEDRTMRDTSDPNDPPLNPPDNKIDATKSESLRYNGPFILVSAGPDSKWGLGDLGGAKAYLKHSQVDDVYNFER